MNCGYRCVITFNGGLTGIDSERMNVCAGNTVGEIESSPRKCAKKADRRIRKRGIQCEPPERNKRERWASESESLRFYKQKILRKTQQPPHLPALVGNSSLRQVIRNETKKTSY